MKTNGNFRPRPLHPQGDSHRTHRTEGRVRYSGAAKKRNYFKLKEIIHDSLGVPARSLDTLPSNLSLVKAVKMWLMKPTAIGTAWHICRQYAYVNLTGQELTSSYSTTVCSSSMFHAVVSADSSWPCHGSTNSHAQKRKRVNSQACSWGIGGGKNGTRIGFP